MRGGEREIISFGQVSVSHGKQVARGGRDQTHSLGIMTSSPQDSGARWRGRVRISPLIRGGTTLKSAESGSGSNGAEVTFARSTRRGFTQGESPHAASQPL